MHNGDWHDGGWGNGGNWWWIPMAIMMIAFWGGLAWIIVTAIRHNTHRSGATTPATAPPPLAAAPTSDPRDVLADRLARGDIDIDDYRARLEALDHGRPRSR